MVWMVILYRLQDKQCYSLYQTEGRMSTRNPLYAGHMSVLKITLQIWERVDVKEDHLQSCGEMARID